MKAASFMLVSVMAMAVSVHSQQEDPTAEPVALPVAPRTLIPSSLQMPVFTPPAPEVVKQVPEMRVDSSVVIPTKNSRTLTILRGEASTLPDLPPPLPPPPYVEPHEPTPEETARRIWHLRHNFHLGATIYDHKISVVNWTDQETLVHYEAVCGFDIGLLAGVGGFVYKGEAYSLMLMHSNFSTEAIRRLAAYMSLQIPKVADGEILITRGNSNEAIAIAPISIIREVIDVEKSRLVPYQEARQRYQVAAAAWHKAHPPIPRDETFWLRPHRGSRYLQPATEGGER